ncbi:MAG TPA: MBL fold metallo-hydrolase [Candidatus Acidoferrales bacterium]|nr:MBL fold metallo-hydrolase [Candidatus Acidoferrales bacterium]
MKLEFIGAAQTVTGSMHLLELNGKKILLECGLYQGKRAESIRINKNFDLFHPAQIDAVILSHAHIDHSGNLPNLVKQGFSGPIYATPATRDLAGIMLADSAKIQEQDTEFLNKKLAERREPPVEPLYTTEDALSVMPLFVSVSYHRETAVTDGVKLTFLDAGHILGSGMVQLRIGSNGDGKTFLFTGDLGRHGLPILKDPEVVRDADVLAMESTYGGKLHDPIEGMEGKLAEVILRTVKRSGKVIIPAFSVERTQEITYTLHRLFENKTLPRIPVFVDSPLSVNATEVFRLHPECFNKDIFKMVINHEDPFGFEYINYIRTVEDSKKLNDINEPIVIISASGMCESGRILHHLANNVGNPNNTIMIVGYQAENTLGRRIIEHQPVLKIFGEEHQLKAEVVEMHSFSAHADHNDLMNFAKNFDNRKLQNIFLVHGEVEGQNALSQSLIQAGYKNICAPKRGDSLELFE